MSVKVIEIVQLFVDRIHQDGYQHRALEDDIYAEKEKRAAAERDRDHWRAARQDAIQAGELMQAEIETLRKQLADAKQEQVDTYDNYEGQIASAEALIDPEASGETTIAGMADQILHLRKQLADAQREASDEFTERQVLTAEQQQDAEIWRQRLDEAQAEVQYLRERLDEERSVSARFLRKLAAAEAAASLQRAGIERLNAFVGRVRNAQNRYQWPASWNEITAALAELDAGTSKAVKDSLTPAEQQ